MNNTIEEFMAHLAGRSIKNLELVCMKRNCPICEYWVGRIDLYESNG